MIAVFSDPLCIWHEIRIVICGICLFCSFYPINKIQKNLVKQTWPCPDKLVILYRNPLQTGLDCLLFWFLFFGVRGYYLLFLLVFANPVKRISLLEIHSHSEFKRRPNAFQGNLENKDVKQEGQMSEHAFNLKF